MKNIGRSLWGKRAGLSLPPRPLGDRTVWRFSDLPSIQRRRLCSGIGAAAAEDRTHGDGHRCETSFRLYLGGEAKDREGIIPDAVMEAVKQNDH
ncbi:hypothetical protein GWI33_013738 [Rhynchophorus ferrugineus]|uniref:Uncharacterized protein n=1 Tax=Rhynchophorus ferrugineus TaxID=354439 RepID=A0A834IRC0_RHYFE|nr:hypothetical protein GWI33_013738 [Rhynchophorus ferrugineus]